MALASISIWTTRRDKARENDKENYFHGKRAAAEQFECANNNDRAEECYRLAMNKSQALWGNIHLETLRAIEGLARYIS
jgi:hypothetical protein